MLHLSVSYFVYLPQTCQLSRIARETHAFEANLTLSRMEVLISRIDEIIIEPRTIACSYALHTLASQVTVMCIVERQAWLHFNEHEDL